MTGLPRWVGIIVVGSVVAINVVAGGMRSITFVQAFQYWFKLLAIALPVLVRARGRAAGLRAGCSAASGRCRVSGLGGATPVPELYSSRPRRPSSGTMGLPHVLVRFYTNVDGSAARRTTVKVLALLGAFYLFPGVAGLLAHCYLGTPAVRRLRLQPAACCRPPRWPAPLATMMTALVAAGAIAAFLSTSSGLVVAAAGVLSTDVLPGRVRDFRLASVVAVTGAGGAGVGHHHAWTSRRSSGWRSRWPPAPSVRCWCSASGGAGSTAAGAVAGLVVGGGTSLIAVVAAIATAADPPRIAWLLAQPAAVSVPLAFATMIGVSLVTRRRIPAGVDAVLARFHLPDGRRGSGARPGRPKVYGT